ncbi:MULTISPECIES: hypothetical protein [unclassified Streptomyces]|uniref:hypothetical protein n=1 Tax=unclassified Streptomyces TaxID=2593676 RepID=UPI0036E7A8BF
MTDSDSSGSGASKSNDVSSGVPDAGTATTEDAADTLEAVSSQIHDFAGVPGKASEAGAGVQECDGKDPKKFFRVWHPWNFAPKKASDIDVAMENLKKKLNTGGWVIKDLYHDNSPNKNLNLVADNDSKKVSVRITRYGKRETPSLGITTISGCYQVPEGETVEQF